MEKLWKLEVVIQKVPHVSTIQIKWSPAHNKKILLVRHGSCRYILALYKDFLSLISTVAMYQDTWSAVILIQEIGQQVTWGAKEVITRFSSPTGCPHLGTAKQLFHCCSVCIISSCTCDMR